MADRILVLEAGRVLEDGTHAQLLAANGRYAHLFALQASGYL
jgi:ABC-type multidrug transport system fused ATPase/permease subunit